MIPKRALTYRLKRVCDDEWGCRPLVRDFTKREIRAGFLGGVMQELRAEGRAGTATRGQNVLEGLHRG